MGPGGHGECPGPPNPHSGLLPTAQHPQAWLLTPHSGKHGPGSPVSTLPPGLEPREPETSLPSPSCHPWHRQRAEGQSLVVTPLSGLRPLVHQSYPCLTSFPSPEALQDRALPGFCPLGRGLRSSKGPCAGQGLARVPELERHPQPGMRLSFSTPEPSRDAPTATCPPPAPRGRLEAEQRTVGPGATGGAVRGEQAGRWASTAVGAGPWVQACGSQPLPGGRAAQCQLLPGDPAGLVGNCAGWGLSEPAQGLCAQPHTGKNRKPPGGEGAQCPRQKEAQLEVARRGRASLADGPLRLTGTVATPPRGSPAHPSQMSQGCLGRGVED